MDDIKQNEFPRGGYIPALDGIRAIAVLLVIIAHAKSTIFTPAILNSPVGYLLNQGGLGVMTFFVISGYLITTLLLREASRGGISLSNFAIRRALRIFPVFYAYLIIICICKFNNILSITWENIACAAGFVYNYQYYLVPAGPSHSVEVNWAVGHFWTLAVEEQFYMIWPLTLAFIGRLRGAAAVVGLAIACLATRVAIYFCFPGLRPGLGATLISVADPLLAGCLLAFADASPSSRPRLMAIVRRLQLPTLILVLLAADRTAFLWLRMSWSLTIGNAALSALIVAVIFKCISRPESWSTRLLESPVLRFIGRRSYSIYIWQQIFCMPENKTVLGVFPINFIATFVVAELSFRFVEQPFVRMKDRLPSGDRRHQSAQISTRVLGK